jgi:hypothetical protein
MHKMHHTRVRCITRTAHACNGQRKPFRLRATPHRPWTVTARARRTAHVLKCMLHRLSAVCCIECVVCCIVCVVCGAAVQEDPDDRGWAEELRGRAYREDCQAWYPPPPSAHPASPRPAPLHPSAPHPTHLRTHRRALPCAHSLSIAREARGCAAMHIACVAVGTLRMPKPAGQHSLSDLDGP